MSDAPERIWFDSGQDRVGEFVPCWAFWQTDDDVEYVRADIHDAALARVSALEAAMLKIKDTALPIYHCHSLDQAPIEKVAAIARSALP